MALEKIDHTLDVRGELCPYPLIEIKVALKRLERGQVLEVLTDYEPTAKTTVPAFCAKTGYPFELTEAERNLWRVVIQKNT